MTNPVIFTNGTYKFVDDRGNIHVYKPNNLEEIEAFEDLSDQEIQEQINAILNLEHNNDEN